VTQTRTDLRRQIVQLIKAERDAGTPYVYGEQTLGRAFDCSGLVVAVLRKLHLVSPTWDDSAHGLYTRCRAIRIDQLQGGDLVFFGKASRRADRPGFNVGHVAIYSGSDVHKQRYIIHAAGGGPGVISAAIARARGARVKEQSLFCRRDLIGFGSIDTFLP
jgi:cell wall-associated NlpC family hydrolase